MKKSVVAIVLFLLLATLVPAQFMPGRIFVKIVSDDPREFPQFREGQPKPDYAAFDGVDEIFQAFPLKALYKPFKTRDLHVQHIYEAHFDPALDVQALIAAWQRLPYIEYAEQLPIYESTYTPNDYQQLQWNLFKINAGLAWDIERGSRNVTVAIVDDAVLITHEDLAPAIWVNPGEIPGDSIDNEGNGWVDDVNGYDISDDDPNPSPPAGATDGVFTHGTHVAGIAGATSDNGIGIASVGFNVSIVPVKAKEDTTIGDPYIYASFTGVDYAISNHFDVVNMSFGSTNYNASFAYLCQAGHDSGTVMIAAAGNTHSYAVHYPSAYDGVISVGSTDFNDNKSSFSTWHYSVDLMAPGGGIYSSLAGGVDHYGFQSGTSMSSPLVAGLAGLMLSADSTLSPDDVLNCLQSTCDNIDAVNQAYVGNIGAGRINAGNALFCVVPTAVAPARGTEILDRIFPNPVEDHMLLSAHLPGPGTLTYQVRDMQGRAVGEPIVRDISVLEDKVMWRRPAGTAAGLYIVHYTFGNIAGTQKVMLR